MFILYMDETILLAYIHTLFPNRTRTLLAAEPDEGVAELFIVEISVFSLQGVPSRKLPESRLTPELVSFALLV